MPLTKILIIENDKFLLKLYSEKLKREGFDVSEAITGNEGLNKVAAQKPNLIILDLILPGKDGFEVLSEIKLNPATKNIPVIILSNLGQESDVKRGLELGAVNYIIKTDFSIGQLPQLVKEGLVKAQHTRAK